MPTVFPLDTQPQFVGGAEDDERRVANGGPGTIYYDNERTVSSAVNDGSLAAGVSRVFTTPTWLATGNTPARVIVEDEADPFETEHLAELAVIREASFNVKYPEYGAIGDGVANDTAAIEAADSAAASSGGTVFFPPGTYKANGLTPSGGVTWQGVGPGSIISLIDPGDATGASVYVDDVDDVTIRDLTITSNATSRTAVYGLIRGLFAARLSVLNCKLLVSSSTSIHLIGCTDFLIEGNYCSGAFADAIHMQRACKRGRVIANHVVDVGDDAISVVSYYDAGATATCEQIVIADNVIYDIDSGRGINLSGGRDITITGNTLVDIDSAGIIIAPSAGSGASASYYPVRVAITANTIRNTGRLGGASTKSGIYLSGARAVSISDNVIDTCAGDGVTLASVCRDISVAGNQIIRAMSRGVLLTQTATTDARLRSELYTDMGETAPATALSGNVEITGNIIRKAVSAGIKASASSVGEAVIGANISDNTILDCGDGGIALTYVTRSILAANRAQNNTAAGIGPSVCTQLVIADNTLAGNTDGLILLDCDDCTVSANVIVANTSGGIYEDADCTGNAVVGNIVKANDSTQYSLRADTMRLVQATRPASYTQTYSTAIRTHANPTATALTNSTGQTPDATIENVPDPTDTPASADALRDDLVATTLPALEKNDADLADAINKLIADMANVKQIVNAVIDDGQTYGLLQ